MAQLAKSAKDVELFGGGALARQGEHRKFKSQSDFGQMRRFKARNYRFQDYSPESLIRAAKNHPPRCHWTHRSPHGSCNVDARMKSLVTLKRIIPHAK